MFLDIDSVDIVINHGGSQFHTSMLLTDQSEDLIENAHYYKVTTSLHNTLTKYWIRANCLLERAVNMTFLTR